MQPCQSRGAHVVQQRCAHAVHCTRVALPLSVQASAKAMHQRGYKSNSIKAHTLSTPVEGCSGRLILPTELPPTDEVAYLLASAATLGLIIRPAGVDDVLLPKLVLPCCCWRSCVCGTPAMTGAPDMPPRSVLKGAASLSWEVSVTLTPAPTVAAYAEVGLPGWLRPSLLGMCPAAALLLSIDMLVLLTCARKAGSIAAGCICIMLGCDALYILCTAAKRGGCATAQHGNIWHRRSTTCQVHLQVTWVLSRPALCVL